MRCLPRGPRLLLAPCLLMAAFGQTLGAAEDDPGPADDQTALVADDNDSEPAGTRTPLILVHGLHGNAVGNSDDIANLNADYFEALISFLTDDPGIRERYKIFRFHYVSDVFPIADIGRAFRNDVDDAIQQGMLPDIEFAIVAHSMGGLVARAYMGETHAVGLYAGQPAGKRVSRLVTLAAPHHGTHGANDRPRLSAVGAGFEQILLSLDRAFWCGSSLCGGEQFVEVTEPNRSDLRWDAYDADAAYDQCPEECNLWLQSLNADRRYDDRISAYFGYVNAETTPLFGSLRGLAFEGIPFEGRPPGPSGLFQFLAVASILGDQHDLAVGGAVLLDRIYPNFAGDGLVSADSAGFAGHDVGRQMGCPGYDHLHMRDSQPGIACENGIELFDNVRNELLDQLALPFVISDRGGSSTRSRGNGPTTTIGYGQISPDAGATTPSGLAIFGLVQNGVLVTEAGVPATEAVQEGRIFAESQGVVNTGLAMANPNDVDATIGFHFTDMAGTDFGSGMLTLGAHDQIAKFLNEAPFDGGEEILGTFTFSSSVPVSVIALRGVTNARSEFLVTTLPVTPLGAGPHDTLYFPHFADGMGWTTQIVLVNPTDETVSGTVEFLGKGDAMTPAEPLTLGLDDGSIGSSFAYAIPARGARRFTTSNPGGTLSSGSVRATAAPGSPAPSGLGIFSLATGGVTVSGAGVPALAEGTAFRVYVEASGAIGQVGSIRSGLAITDASGTANTVTLELTGLDGTPAGAAETLVLGPSGQVAQFVDELFDLPVEFSGVLRVTATADIALVGLRGRTNARSDFLITTTPPVSEADPPTSANRFFPHIVDSGGWVTQFVLYSGTAGQASSGWLGFTDQAGQVPALSFD